MTRLTTEELQALHDAKDWRALWVQAIPYVHMAATSFRTADKEDLIQHGLLAVGPEIRNWDPARSPFQAHIYARSKYAMSRRLKREARAANAAAELEQDAEQDAASPLGVTYDDSGHVPQGYGDPVAELARMGAPEAADRLLRRLPPEVALWLRELWGMPAFDGQEEPGNVRAIAARRGIPRTSMNDILRKAKTFLVTEQEAGQYPFTADRPVASESGFWNIGMASVMGDTGAWRESTGSVWKDWAYRPTADDILRGARR